MVGFTRESEVDDGDDEGEASRDRQAGRTGEKW